MEGFGHCATFDCILCQKSHLHVILKFGIKEFLIFLSGLDKMNKVAIGIGIGLPIGLVVGIKMSNQNISEVLFPNQNFKNQFWKILFFFLWNTKIFH